MARSLVSRMSSCRLSSSRARASTWPGRSNRARSSRNSTGVKASGLPYHVVDADASRPGMGDSIAAGVRATPDAPGWLILPADLPLISPSTLRAIAFAAPCAVTVPVYQGQRGHPVRFGRVCASDLLNLQGNQGAAQIIRAQTATNSVAFLVVNDTGCVTDIDTLDDLARAEKLLSGRLV